MQTHVSTKHTKQKHEWMMQTRMEHADTRMEHADTRMEHADTAVHNGNRCINSH